MDRLQRTVRSGGTYRIDRGKVKRRSAGSIAILVARVDCGRAAQSDVLRVRRLRVRCNVACGTVRIQLSAVLSVCREICNDQFKLLEWPDYGDPSESERQSSTRRRQRRRWRLGRCGTARRRAERRAARSRKAHASFAESKPPSTGINSYAKALRFLASLSRLRAAADRPLQHAELRPGPHADAAEEARQPAGAVPLRPRRRHQGQGQHLRDDRVDAAGHRLQGRPLHQPAPDRHPRADRRSTAR